MKKTLRIGSNRGQPRIWIEGSALAAEGWTRGTPFIARFGEGIIEYQRTDSGCRKVAGNPDRPIIDTNSASITESFGDAPYATVHITPDKITMTPAWHKPSKVAGAVAAVAIAAASIAAPYLSQFAPGAQRVLVACEESATVRNAFAALGHDAVSIDLMETRDPFGWHVTGDVMPYLSHDWDLVVGFPPCTYLTVSAAYAFKDPDYDKYPGVGYHQRLAPDTLRGEARRKARQEAVAFVLAIYDSCSRVAIENPVGSLSTFWRKPDQVIHPYEHGHPEAKSTCLWLKNLEPLRPTCMLDITEHGYQVRSGKHKGKWRWQNQCPGGGPSLPPSADRAKIKSKTYSGIAAAMAATWGRIARPARRSPVVSSLLNLVAS